MVNNKPLIRPYFLGGVALGGVARIPLICFLVFWGATQLTVRCFLEDGSGADALFQVLAKSALKALANFWWVSWLFST